MMLRETLVGYRVKLRDGPFSKGRWATVIPWNYEPGIYIETPTLIAIRFDDGLEGPVDTSALVSYVKPC